jgi:hypothetical protein
MTERAQSGAGFARRLAREKSRAEDHPSYQMPLGMKKRLVTGGRNAMA